MKLELLLLRAVLRLSRAGRPATLASVLVRVDAPRAAVFDALATLRRHGLVDRDGRSIRLTMMGLAVAIATVPPVADAVEVSRSDGRAA